MADTFSFEDAAKPSSGEPFSFEEAKAKPEEKTKETSTTVSGVTGAVTRGLAPYAAGAVVGAAAGAPLAGVGAIPGAIAGAGAVGLTQLATGLYGPIARALGLPEVKTPQEATDAALDTLNVKRPQTATERFAEATTGGAAGALTGAGAAGEVAGGLTGTPKAIAGKLAQKPALQTVGGVTGGAAAQTAAEAGAGPVGQMIAGMVGGGLPAGVESVRTPRINASQNAKNAINAGFVLPPAEASEGHIGEVNLTNIAAGEAGKVKLAQYAAAKNQPIVNSYAQKDLKLEPGTTLTPEVFDSVREREGKVYREVAGAVPEVDLARDKQFREDARNVGGRSEETERLFPSTTEPPEVTSLRQELLAHSRGGTQAVMDYIADLRFKAKQNFQAIGNAMAHRTGAAQREAATALEDAMERSVKNAPEYYKEKLDQAVARRGEATADFNYANQSAGYLPVSEIGTKINAARAQVEAANAEVRNWTQRLSNAENRNSDNQTLLDRFREARTIMAKSYDIESVTNVSTGDVSATGLGRLLQRGKPLTGNLKLIADSANSFRRAFQNPAAFGGVEPLSVLDMAVAGLGAMKGHVAPAVAVISRPWLRSRVLSPGYQQGMISDQPKALPILPSLLDPGAFSTVSPAQSAASTLDAQ